MAKRRDCFVDYGDTVKIQKLALALGKPIVFFDIEHSGYSKDQVGLTEFAAIVLDNTGEIERFNTLIDPQITITYFAMKVSKIGQWTVKGAPKYQEAVLPFLEKHKNSVWSGFNSNSSDISVIEKQHTQLKLNPPIFKHKLDVMHLSKQFGMKGSLSKLIEQINPNFDCSAHVALADVSMTIHLLEHLLYKATYGNLKKLGLNLQEETPV
jgi:DNA polymerase III alpha subunit (gram-positive type)